MSEPIRIDMAGDAADEFRRTFNIDSAAQAEQALNNKDALFEAGEHGWSQANRDAFDWAAEETKRRFDSGQYKDGDLAKRKAAVKPNNYSPPGSKGNTVGKIVPQTSPQANPPNDQPETQEEKGWWERWGSDATHGALGLASFVPGLSVVTGALDAGVYAAEGDYVNAMLSATSIIPGGKVVTTAGKVITKGAKLAKGAEEAAKAAKLTEEAAKLKKLKEEAAAAKQAAEKAAKEKAEKEAAEAGAEKANAGKRNDGGKIEKEKPDHGAGKSSKKYGHARNEHGSQRDAQELKDRARSTGDPQGHFSDNRMIEEAFEKAPSTPGVHEVQVSKPSNVYYPNGTTAQTNTVRVVIKPAPKGPRTAFPYIP